MAYVVTEPCFNCKYTDCVAACPVDAFHEGQSMLYIGDDCIDCDACVHECPVEAIFPPDAVPEEWQGYIELNAEMSEKTPRIAEMKDALKVGECEQK